MQWHAMMHSKFISNCAPHSWSTFWMNGLWLVDTRVKKERWIRVVYLVGISTCMRRHCQLPSSHSSDLKTLDGQAWDVTHNEEIGLSLANGWSLLAEATVVVSHVRWWSSRQYRGYRWRTLCLPKALQCTCTSTSLGLDTLWGNVKR